MKTEIRGEVYTFPDTNIWRISERVAGRLGVGFYRETQGKVYLPSESSDIIDPPGHQVIIARKGISEGRWVYYTMTSGTKDLDDGLLRLREGGLTEGLLVKREYERDEDSYSLRVSLKEVKTSGRVILTYFCPTFDLFVERFTNHYVQGDLRERVIGKLRINAVDLLKEYPWIGDRKPTKDERIDNIIVENFDVTGSEEDELTELFMELVDSMS